MSARLLAVALAVVAVLASPVARAHGMRTAFVAITETTPGSAIANVRLPVATDAVTLEVPSTCRATTLPSESERVQTMALACDGSLAGATLGVHGLGPLVSEAILSVELADGTRATHVVTSAAPTWTLQRAKATLSVFRDYGRLGVMHIATGADHLLFLLMLVLVLRRPRAVILAETAFTVSHALSFTATALEWVHVSARAAEACIAVSLILLALDVAKQESAPRVHATVAMAFVFGLVHGLGFAGGLREIGLPERDVASALLGFAGGVEAGQVAFVLALLGCVAIAERVRAFAHVARVAAYGTGGVASFWFLQRLVLVLQR